MEFEKDIKDWINIDNQLRKMNEEIRTLRTRRNDLTDDLIIYASENKLTHKLIKITDGNLKFQNRKETPPLTFKLIKKCLLDCINNEEQVTQLINYIKENRETKYVGEIKRSYTKD